MSSSPESSAATSSIGNAPGADVDLIERHRQLRAQLRWLLPVGAALLLLLIYQLAAYPERAALTGYRYQQVGVQPDSTWWILAYRNGKAEILFSRDTAQGWQRRELGVDSAEARSLALNWGGKAILVGDGGAVRVYDSLFRPIDSVRHPLGKGFLARWVAADNSGLLAAAIGDSAKAFYSADGGRQWYSNVATAGVITLPHNTPEYGRERAAFGRNDEWAFASRYDYQVLYDYQVFNPGNHILETNSTFKNPSGTWAITAAAVDATSPIIYFGVSAQNQPRLLRANGTADTVRRHFSPAEVSDQFPTAAKPIDAAFSPTRPGYCLLISRTRVFAGRLGGPFTSLQPAVASDSTTAGKTSAPPSETTPGTASKTPDKTKSANTNKAQQKKVAAKLATVKKADIKNPSVPKPDTTGAAQKRAAAAKSKSAQQNPIQQTTLPNNPAIQQTAPPANDKKATETKEDATRKPESAK